MLLETAETDDIRREWRQRGGEGRGGGGGGGVGGGVSTVEKVDS